MNKFGGDWTEKKLDCVSEYMHAYTTIMNKQRLHFAYVDGFAGTGYRGLGSDEDKDEITFPDLASQEVREFRYGSVRRALEVEPRFEKYIFIDNDKENYSELEKLKNEFLLKEEFSEGTINCVHEDSNKYLKDLCRKDWTLHRSLVFLDPYGLQVEWETIESIAKTQAIDLWLLFPIGPVNRLLRRDAEIQLPIRNRLDRFFGDEGWFEEFYSPTPQFSLLDEDTRLKKQADIFSAITQYLQSRLKKLFKGVADNPLILRNSKNVPLYLLCFAAGNPKGAPIAVKIATDILSKLR